MTLLIGQAWEETKAVFRADGKAIVAVALALTVLPGAILETAAPSNLRPADAPLWLSLLGFLSALLGITSQIAISRIALGPSTTVGSALALGFRRVLPLFGALIIVVLPFVLLIALLGFSQGGQFTPQSIPPVLALPITAIMLALLFVLVRLMFMTPVAAETGLGSIGLIKSAWRLSRGRVLKLFLLILLLLVVALLLIGALGGALSAVVILALGPVAPWNTSALLVALIQQALAALVSMLFVVMVSRLYVQAKGGEAQASVPHAGHD